MKMRWLEPSESFLAPECSLAGTDAQVAILQAPLEISSTYGRGSAAGPNAILEASRQVEFFDTELGFAPCRKVQIATASPVEPDGLGAAAYAERLQEAVGALLQEGQFVIVLGGEHSSAVGAVRAHCARFPDVTVLQIDAHSDLRPVYLRDPWNHACTMARVRDFQERIVQVGIRSEGREERDLVERERIAVFYAHRIHADEENGRDWIASIVDALSPQVYVTFDCDALDPSVIPATGAPEPGGLTWRQVNGLLSRVCEEREVVGLDVCELAPVTGLHHPQVALAKLIYRFIGWRFASAQPPSSSR